MLINVSKYTIIGASGSISKYNFALNIASFLQKKENKQTYIFDFHSDDFRWYTDNLPIENTIDLVVSKPKLLRNKCKLCASCARNCEYGAIAIDKNLHEVSINYDKCVGCSLCLNYCDLDALEEVHCEIGVINEYAIANEIKLLEGLTPKDFFYPHLIVKALEKRIEPDSIIINNVSITDDGLISELVETSDAFICFISDKSELMEYQPLIDNRDSMIIISKVPFNADNLVQRVIIFDEEFSFDNFIK